MPHTYDVIVLGLGGFGSATLLHLAERGLRVLGLDQHGVAHDRGSSHGENRIIRKAYFEHPDYVPLLQRSYELWRDLEQASGTSLYEECGLFLSGTPTGDVVRGARESAQLHGLRLDDVPHAEAVKRFPLFDFDPQHAIVFEHEAGYLRVEEAVRAHVEQARRLGADDRAEAVVDWSAEASMVRVRTTDNEYAAAQLVIAAGAWAERLLSDLNLSLSVLRKVQFWHQAQSAEWLATPAFFFQQPEGCFYGFPATRRQDFAETLTVKLAEHTGGDAVENHANLVRSLRADDAAATNAFVARTLRHIDPHPLRHSVCMYTMTPDGHFIVDRHPQHQNVLLAAGFSGHGFKFTPVIGQALSDMVVDGSTTLPIKFLQLNRPGLTI